MPIILDPDKQFIAISTYFVEEKKRHGNSIFHFIRSRDDFEEWKGKGYMPEDELSEDQKKPDKIINKVVTQWKTLSWKDQNSILAKSLKQTIKQDGTPVQEINAIAYRDLKLKYCLKRWDVKDEDGKIVEITESVIDNLNPAFANELLVSFEEITEPSINDLKN